MMMRDIERGIEYEQVSFDYFVCQVRKVGEAWKKRFEHGKTVYLQQFRSHLFAYQLLAIVVSVVFLVEPAFFYLVWGRHVPHDHFSSFVNTFRPSRSLKAFELDNGELDDPLLLPDNTYLESLTSTMKTYLKKHPSDCGIAAINYGIAIQWVCLQDGRCFANPRYMPETSQQIMVPEHSLLCADSDDNPTRTYSAHIRLLYNNTDTLLMQNAEAVCLQHFVDIFQGQWPCERTGPHEFLQKLPLPDINHSGRY